MNRMILGENKKSKIYVKKEDFEAIYQNHGMF